MDYGATDAWPRLAQALLRNHRPWPSRSCAVVECEPAWSWTPRLTDFDLWFVLAGHGQARLGAQQVELHPGLMAVLRPGDRGQFSHDRTRPLTVAFCHFDLGARAAAPPGDLLPSRFVPLATPAVQAEQMRTLIRLADDPHPLVAVERAGLLTSVLLDIYRQDAAMFGHPVNAIDPRINRVVSRVRARPGRRLSLAAAGDLAGLSPAHFSRLFRAHVGISFRDFCLHARMDRARELLGESTMSIGEISRALGYDEPQLFSRQVRAHWGTSPSQLRAGR